jgi:hypothetical protein
MLRRSKQVGGIMKALLLLLQGKILVLTRTEAMAVKRFLLTDHMEMHRLSFLINTNYKCEKKLLTQLELAKEVKERIGRRFNI